MMTHRGSTGQLWTERSKLRLLREKYDFTTEDIKPAITNILVKLPSLRESDVELHKPQLYTLGGDLIVREGVVYAKFQRKEELSLLVQGFIKFFLGFTMIFLLINIS